MEILQASSIDPSKTNAKKGNKYEASENLTALKEYIEEYLTTEHSKENCCVEMRQFFEKVKLNDVSLKNYLRGRKNDPFHAWDTIRRYAENKFQVYPEVFPGDGIPEKVRKLVEGHVLGVLKNRDKFGRRIIFVDMTKWDTKTFTVEDVTMTGVLGAERFWQQEDILENGVILIQNTKGFGLAHAKQHTIHTVMRMKNVLLYCFPIKVKGLFYINAPRIFTYGCKMVKPLFPKKLSSRMFVFSANETPSELFDIAPPEILPTWIGGTLPIADAAEDVSYYEAKLGMN